MVRSHWSKPDDPPTPGSQDYRRRPIRPFRRAPHRRPPAPRDPRGTQARGPACCHPYRGEEMSTRHPNAAPAAEVVARYSFVCNAGCGVCGVKVKPFEYERTETLEGEHLGSKYQPQIVSSCCGAEVHVYDNEAD